MALPCNICPLFRLLNCVCNRVCQTLPVAKEGGSRVHGRQEWWKLEGTGAEYVFALGR